MISKPWCWAAAIGLIAQFAGPVRDAAAQPKPAPVGIVAAESVYGDVARQIAGPDAGVTSILSSPDQDPHQFEASPATARALADADIVIANGAGYDPWIEKLLGASAGPGRQVIIVGDLLHRGADANPHLWYDPAAMPAVAKALAGALVAKRPDSKAQVEQLQQQFAKSLKPLGDKIASMRARHSGKAVTATEPVFGLMAQALGLQMRNERFQLAVMNGTEPSASDVVAFERDLRQRRVRVLIYNSQATSPAARRLLKLAEQARVYVVGVTETLPAGMRYQDWMIDQLEALDKALSAAPR